MTYRTVATSLVVDALQLWDQDRIAWANVLELLAYMSGLKPVVRLVVDDANREALAEFCHRQRWPWRWSGFWLEPVFRTSLNDTFTRLAYSQAPADCERVLFIGHEAATCRAEQLESRMDLMATRELAALYSYPECCVTAYTEIQNGKSWLEMFLHDSNPADRLRDWHSNKIAYLFPPHLTLLPEYFPCSVDCEQTTRLARTYEAVLQDCGLRELLDIICERLMRPLLLFDGILYRFGGLKWQEGWYHITGSTECRDINIPARQQRPAIGAIEALRIDQGELTVRCESGEWCEPLVPAHTQLLQFG